MKYAPLLLALVALFPTTMALGQTTPVLARSFDDLNSAVRNESSDGALQDSLGAQGFSKPDYDDASWDMYVKIGADCDSKKIPSQTQLDPKKEKNCVIVDVVRNDAGPVWAVLSQWGDGFKPSRYGIAYETGKGSPALAEAKNSDEFMAAKMGGLKTLLAQFKKDLAKPTTR